MAFYVDSKHRDHTPGPENVNPVFAMTRIRNHFYDLARWNRHSHKLPANGIQSHGGFMKCKLFTCEHRFLQPGGIRLACVGTGNLVVRSQPNPARPPNALTKPDYCAEQARGRHFDPSASRLKLVLVM